MCTLFERLGGETAVEQAVERFYRKVLRDGRINHFFDDVDMGAQIHKQKGFLTMAFGGPNRYTGQDLREGHRHLVERGLNDEHVDVVIELLGESLRELGVEDTLIQEIAAIAEGARDTVLNR